MRLLSLLIPLVAGVVLVAFAPPEAPPAAANEAPAPLGPLAKKVEGCKKCHADTHGEWLTSRHAVSWSNPVFQAAIKGREDGGDSCARCHAPESILKTGLGALPEARDNEREVGVNCFTCHIVGSRYHGPYKSKGHGGIKANPDYRKAVLCNSCHGQPEARAEHDQGTTWGKRPEAERKACQECHMEATTRKLVTNEKLPARFLIGEQECRTHGFASVRTGRKPTDAVKMRFVTTPEGEKLGLLTQTGHAMPASSGRVLLLVRTWKDAAGEVLHQHVNQWLFPKGPMLLAGEEALLEMPAVEGAKSIEARLELHVLAIEGRDEQSVHPVGTLTKEL